MRSIFLRPDGLDQKVQAFREIFDPLGKLIEPHITVVFPFESKISDEALIEHVSTKIASIPCFDASLCSQPVKDSGYVYFPIKEGVEKVVLLNKILYVGILADYRKGLPYRPHLTVGRAHPDKAQHIKDEASKLEIATKFKITTITIERIGRHDQSEVISEFSLGLGT